MENEHDRFVILGYQSGSEGGIYWIDNAGNWHYAHSEPKNAADGETEYAMRYDFVAQHLKWLQREVLDVTEAALDGQKLEAVKRLIKDKFSAKLSWLYETTGKIESQQDGLGDD